MYITKELTARMEACIKQTHLEFTRLYPAGKILELSGGAACFSGFDSYFSQVIGWGFTTKPQHFKAEIKTIEHFYQTLNHPRVDIELCPFVGNDLVVFLSQRGYVISELNNVSCLDLNSYQPHLPVDDEFIVKEIKRQDIPLWAKVVAHGFGYPKAQEQFINYAKAKGVKVFAVMRQEEIIAGATIALHGDVCDLGVTSTLPGYRGKGLHKKLLFTRLNYAKKQGLALATVTTEAGSISDLNSQKAGFRSAYTRIKLTLELR